MPGTLAWSTGAAGEKGTGLGERTVQKLEVQACIEDFGR